MNIPLRVLIVEDSEDDAQLLLRELKRAGYDPIYERVDTFASMNSAIDKEIWDIVISDYAMPNFSGLDALKLVRKRNQDIPFIMVSGTVGEEVAVQMLKAGASDYLLKDRISRLIPAVERELREAKTRRERKKADDRASRIEVQSQLILNSALEGIMGIDLVGNITFVNPTTEKMLGWEARELIGKYSHSLYHHTKPDGKPYPAEECPIYNAYKKGAIQHTTDEIFWRKDGSNFHVEYSSTPITHNGKIIGAVVVFEDITKRKRDEEALLTEKERLAVTLRSIADGVITTDIKGRIALMNKSAEKFTGWESEEAKGMPLMEVFNIVNEKTGKRCENPVENVLKTSGIFVLASNTILISKDGTKRVIADSAAPIKDRESKVIGTVIVFRDTTEKRKIEEEQLKATKLESVGILAGGIAHDFNNILTALSGNLSIAKTLVDPKDKIYRRFSEFEKALIRAESLTQQLLTFAKGGAPIKKATTIMDLIKDTVTFALRGSNIRCEFSFHEKLCTLEVDEGQISQVINNLVINARQAMPKGGVIKVSCEHIANSRNIADYTGTLLKEGEYARISVKDEGVGIPKENLAKIFDPYYTTKEKGNGLGLTTSYSIVKNHGGLISVDSKVGVGTIFHIYLPALKGQITEKEEAMTEESRDSRNKGKILVMDDDELVRDVIGGMLEVLGYEAGFARNGEETIESYKKAKAAGEPFDAVIMDLTIAGGMGGKEAITKLLEIDPKVKGIVSSGYSTDPIMADYKGYGFVGVVVKPYRMKELADTIQSVIAKK